ncbi:hypothetical protein WOLCODRAFT_145721 [Wolfiporia cocos MD-104 SS10]|uniref:Recombination protein Rad52 n=1 Tax=Wolfiporia cocos (strain MD-104) TaxID=742152 RepID=A0A2H3J913_WOLCO|nr:hypothetical protein WOLCODRAFT_145721 [Wolfiporia cocos MD-104 SS10]
MSGAFSGHLIDSFLAAQQHSKGPFGQSLTGPSQLAFHGPMSFVPQMHGAFDPHTSSMFQDASYMSMSEESAQRIATLQAKLNKRLGPEYISQRPGPGGGPKLTYAEGWKIINLANEVFGFNGWSSSIVNLTTDFIDMNEDTKRISVGVTAIVRVTLRDGVYHEDVGYGLLENAKGKGAALDKCKKEAVTDAVKRTLRNFGNLLGNCLYDKTYTQEVIKIKVPPPKFDKNDLYRRPEFDESRTNPDTSAPIKHSMSAVVPAPAAIKSETKSEPHSARMDAILSVTSEQSHPAVPPHVCSTSTSNASPSVAMSTPNPKNSPGGGVFPTGLSTPVHTPATAQGHGARPSAALQNQGQRQGSSHSHGQGKDNGVQSNDQRNVSTVQAERRVSFAQQPAVGNSASSAIVSSTHPPEAAPPPHIPEDDTDEYTFASEDDAFFAEVDLGEDAGIGGPIDYDEGPASGDSMVDENGSGGEAHCGTADRSSSVQHKQPRQQPTPYAPASNNGVQQHSRTPLPRVGQSVTGNQQQRNVHGNQNPAVRDSSAGPSAVPASITTPNANGGNSQRTPTLSMGGFRFPPGVNPQTVQGGATPGPTGIGLKRSMDAMLGQNTAMSRRPAQGMGLAPHSSGGRQVQQAAAAQKREPLAALEVGESGDTKRVRR